MKHRFGSVAIISQDREAQFPIFIMIGQGSPRITTLMDDFLAKSNLGDSLAFVGYLLWKICLNNRFKSSGESFCFDLD